MSQIELIEDYLTNRLDEGAKSAFEQQIAADPQLKAEVNLQREIIESVKQARISELKAMLNNVPIGGGASLTIGKVALATLSAGLVGTFLYFALNTEPSKDIAEPTETIVAEEQVVPAEQPEETQPPAEESQSVLNPESEKETTKRSSSEVKKMTSPKPMSPKIEVLDLTGDVDTNSQLSEPPKPSSSPTVSASSIEVETDNSNKNYPFHYQFKEGKLLLYGPFDESLYEIIEINGGTHTLFLYYKNSYYSLSEEEHQVVPLIMIRDLELLRMLDKYRGKK